MSGRRPRHVFFIDSFSATALLAMATVLTPGQPGGVNLDTDAHLAGWWRFDDAQGTTAKDASPHGRNATLAGGLSFDRDGVPGRIGKALRLDGGDDLIEVSGYKGVTGAQARTVAAWVKTKRGGGEIAVWGEDEPGKLFRFRLVRSGIWVDPKGGYLYTKEKVHDDVWHHIAVVVEPAEAPNLHDNVKLYVDGELQEIHDIGLLDLFPIDTAAGMDVRIGRRFQGLLDDLRIYDRALSEDELQALVKAAGGS